MYNNKSIRRVQSLFAAALLAVALPAGAACVTGSSSEVQVQAKLDEYAGAGSLSALTSCVAEGSDSLWRATQPMAQADLRFEFAGYAPSNAFGIYDPLGNAMLQIFSGADASDTSRMLSMSSNANGVTFSVLGAGATVSQTFTSNLFGFYLLSPDGLFRSESSANSDGRDHLVAFRLPYFPDRYLLGWEDLLGGGDGDFNDMGVIVSNVAPVPLPAAAWLLLSGLAGVATFTRRRRASPA